MKQIQLIKNNDYNRDYLCTMVEAIFTAFMSARRLWADRGLTHLLLMSDRKIIVWNKYIMWSGLLLVSHEYRQALLEY